MAKYEANGEPSVKSEMGHQIINTKDINIDDIPEYIKILEEHQANCQKNGKYIDAQRAKNKIEELKIQLENSKKVDYRQQHEQEKMQLEQAHVSEFNQFNEFWDKRMLEFNEQAQLIEEQMIQRHQEELAKYLEDLEAVLPVKPKDSPELLNMRKIEELLAKQEDYIEAHKVQQKCLKMEKEEIEKWKIIRDQKIKNQRIQIEQKQQTELQALRKRIATGQEEQRKSRAAELERLLQKYQNSKKELEIQHQIQIQKVSRPSKPVGGSLYSAQGSRIHSARPSSRK
mmetsp:Transcript_19807/g.22806  ORF Transcript_19807/g.22806 Transcript_19807/m.22806 type:complete len:285 (+) Transcript_19807:52-906(+)